MNENTQKEIEKLRKQISQQEKMASLGLLSAGIAHEIQNPLNFVINFSKVSQKLLKDMQEVLDELGDALPEDSVEEIKEIMSDLEGNMNKIEENGNRASGIVRGILLYSRGKDDEYIPTDLHQLTKEYVWLSYHAVKANNKSFNVAIQEEYAVDLPLVKVIPQDFSRAILNLMNNACYAVFSKSKEIADATYQPTIRVCLKKEGDRINLSIEDNGQGISEETKKKLYTPFFTTKPIGEGTGLGLSITKSIIEQKHNGTIEMDTRPGEYTRFTISIPIQQ
ncbi:sensor histidine kinase [Parabacteroides goldsteinii]|uniref:sensor histidine kinase n=1 Tax=Parabacteroides goldsteinii TaxID=328812 RepID=UPI00101DE851|nr:HAMP domain-containing sensor histidine kinase [Parabacteroides goldsteinii]